MFLAKKLCLALASAATSAIHAAKQAETGYLIDNLCLDMCEGKAPGDACTPDNTNVIYSPQEHTGWCLLLDVCVESRYTLLSRLPDADGKHTPLLSITGDDAHANVVQYIKDTNPYSLESDNRAHFPLVTVVYDEDDLLAATSDGATPRVLNATIVDTWSEDSSVYAGDDTTQTVCNTASEADVDANNLCFRSDVKVSKLDEKNMYVIESGGCPDHENMSGGSNGKVSNSQVMPDRDCGAAVTWSDTCGGGCDSCNGCCSSAACGGGCDVCSGCGSGGTCSGGTCDGSSSCSACGGSGSSCCGSYGDCDASCGGSTSSGGCGSTVLITPFPRHLAECGSCCGSKGDCGVGGCCSSCNACGGGSSTCCGTGSCGVSCCGVSSDVLCDAGCSCSCGDDHGVTKGKYSPTYQHYTMLIPQDPGAPVSEDEATPITDNVVGIMSNGVLVDTHQQTWSYDLCTGHSDTKGQYHYHVPPICYLKSMGVTVPDNANWWIDDNGSEVRPYDEMSNQFESTGSSPVVGFARDGFPIYALYDAENNLQRSKAYGGDLDKCNGKIDKDGLYAYYITAEPPFVPTCLRGTIGSFSYAPTDIVCPRKGITNTISFNSAAVENGPSSIEDKSKATTMRFHLHVLMLTVAGAAAFYN